MTYHLQILRIFACLTLLTGVAYPLFITGIAQLFMTKTANGSLVEHQGKIIGSSLIAQSFTSDRYFWPRPSAADYNPLPSRGSNLGPTSSVLKAAIEQRKSKFNEDKIPSELLFGSGSGLDPHISPNAAYFQIARIVKARGLDPENGVIQLKKLIDDNVASHRLGILGAPCVNVLQLNLALDAIYNNGKLK